MEVDPCVCKSQLQQQIFKTFTSEGQVVETNKTSDDNPA